MCMSVCVHHCYCLDGCESCSIISKQRLFLRDDDDDDECVFFSFVTQFSEKFVCVCVDIVPAFIIFNPLRENKTSQLLQTN